MCPLFLPLPTSRSSETAPVQIVYKIYFMLSSVEIVWFRCDPDGVTEIDGGKVDNRES